MYETDSSFVFIRETLTFAFSLLCRVDETKRMF